MTVTVLELNENEDGTANLVFGVDDPAYVKHLIEDGLNFVLLKAAFGLTTSELAKILEERAMTEVDNRRESP